MFRRFSDYTKPHSLEKQLEKNAPVTEYGTVADGQKVWVSHAHPRIPLYLVPVRKEAVELLHPEQFEAGFPVLHRRRCIWTALEAGGWKPEDWSEYPNRSDDPHLHGGLCDECDLMVLEGS